MTTGMKTIGIIGGMSWLSSITYYRLLNQYVAGHLGAPHSARVILHSVDFGEVIPLQQRGAWEEAGELLACAARSLEAAGADFLLIGAVTMHKVADAVQSAVRIPLLHIVDVTSEAILSSGMSKVGLLGTRYTMEDDFVVSRLGAAGIDTVIPLDEDRKQVHQVIFEELAKGIVSDESRRQLCQIIDELGSRGAQGVILGCTELMLLIHQSDCKLQLFDTTSLHVEAAGVKALDVN
jgi:aspartate racemase